MRQTANIKILPIGFIASISCLFVCRKIRSGSERLARIAQLGCERVEVMQ
jgi:hypothetical protein